MLWILRKPRKILSFLLTLVLLWILISFFFSRQNRSKSQNDRRSVRDKTLLSEISEYDVEESLSMKRIDSKMKDLGSDENDIESKLKKAVDRKKNLMKREYLKMEENIEHLRLKEKKEEEQEEDDEEEIAGEKEEELDTALKKKSNKIKQDENVFQLATVSLTKFKTTPLKTKQPHHQLPINQHQMKFNVENYGHNEVKSGTISLHRSLPDIRDPQCLNLQYSEDLPDASVIIAFYNEAWTTLLRTIHSVFDRSPPMLIKEVILIDDFSDYEHLQQQLTDYVALLPKVQLKRTDGRIGVIKARQLGASVATGKVLIFIDSHCECALGWLEPLLSRIAQKMTHVVTPVMDIIDDETFEYKSFDAKSINIGGFDWNLQFLWIGIPERLRTTRSSDIDFIKSPTMPGGMFAISKKYFIKLGGFDLGMDMWGAENLEMSFKIWMCGGTLETIPCSHIGHLFRRGSSYRLGSGNTRKNFFRLAEVWMDSYKEIYYEKAGDRPSEEDANAVVNRKILRKQLKCKTFDWFLETVYPELFIPSEAIASGEIKNKELGFADDMQFPACLDAVAGSNPSAVKIWPCHNQEGNQLWLLSKSGEIRRDDGCMDYSGKDVVILPCHSQKGNQLWEYTSENQIRHMNSKFCMGLSSDSRALVMSECIDGKKNQTWKWKRPNKKETAVVVKSHIDDKQLLQEVAMENF